VLCERGDLTNDDEQTHVSDVDDIAPVARLRPPGLLRDADQGVFDALWG
jgi:hypothetical protein